jgi:hypothetical protein
MSDDGNNLDAGDLTLGRLQQVLDGFEDRRAAEDVEAFLKFGDNFRAFRSLCAGGTLVIGGHRRGGSRGAAAYDEIRQAMPDVRCYLTEFVPDGTAYVLRSTT